MDGSTPPRDVFDRPERGKRVRLVLKAATDEKPRPDDPFETEVEWVHSRRDERDMTITYRAEFEPPERQHPTRASKYTVLSASSHSATGGDYSKGTKRRPRCGRSSGRRVSS